MANIGGPKGPGGRNPALQRFLDAERAKRTSESRGVAATPPPPGQRPTDRFADVPGLSGQSRTVPGGLANRTAGQGALSVRLSSLTGADVTSGPLEKTPGPEKGRLRITHGPAGKIAEGNLSVTKAADLEALKGVVHLKGSFDLSESLLQPSELAALSSLERVEGNLALEGNVALAALSALEKLRQVDGNLYLGFNDGLEVAALPQLTAVGGALIIEGNRALSELSLPALASVGGYLHLHENDALASVALASLADVGGELSVLDNPRLLSVDMRALERLGGQLQVVDNGASVLSGLPLVS